MWKPFSYSQIDPKLMKDLTARQNELAKKVLIQPLGFTPQIIAGVDSSLVGEDKIFSIIVVFSYPNLEVLEIKHEIGPLEFPYIPGFLAFREIPTILKAYNKLENIPELLVVDGNGIIHKRKMGIASHLGVLLNTPSLGIAKKLLIGSFEMPDNEIRSYTKVLYKDEQLGFALRSKTNVKPVFVSPGNLINLEDSLKFVISVLGKYRLPEPTRIADKYSKEMKPKIKAH
jgi:deoxyribonuclease V